MEYTRSFPFAIAIIKIVIKEQPFTTTRSNIGTAEEKRLARKAVEKWKSWVPDEMTDMGPIVRYGITWIHVVSVDVHVWVRTGRNAINIDAQSISGTQKYSTGVSI